MADDDPHPAPVDLDTGLLSLFVGLAATERAMEALADNGFGDLRFSHGFVFQHLVTGPRTMTDLAARQGVSVQAISKAVKELVALGYVTLDTDPTDGRARLVSLTARARTSIDTARTARGAVDDSVRTALGERRHQQLRKALVDALDALGGAEGVGLRRIRLPG